MTQFVIECGPLSLVWIPNPQALNPQALNPQALNPQALNPQAPNPLVTVTKKIKCGVFEMRSGPEHVGTISFVGAKPPHAVIGYEVLPEFRGRGFASSAVAAVLSVAPDFGFSVLTAQCRSNNAHSRRVLEKTGFILSSSAPFWTNTPSSTKARRSTKKRDMSLLFMVYQWIATPAATISDLPCSPERPMK